MTPEDQDPDDAGRPDRAREAAEELRRRAEVRMEAEPRQLPMEAESLSNDEIRRTIHELHVHQIELEMQNEELRQSRADLEASHARYFDLFDQAPVGYFTLAEDARILDANLTGCELLGVPRSGLVDQPFTRFIVPDDQDDYYHHRRAVTEAGSSATCELRVVRGDGSTLHALLESTPSLPVDDQATFRTVVSDITARTRATAERLLLEKRLRQVEKAESLGRMAGAMAHHFNNLLGVITGNLELALEGASDELAGTTPDVTGDLRDALESTRKATDLTQLLLAYLGHARSEPILLDLSGTVQRGVSLLQIAMPPGTELTADLPKVGPSVLADPGDIQQLLTNLVTNAWEAAEPGSTSIHLSISTVRPSDIPEAHRVPAGWQPNALPYACIEVRDDGPGIEPGKLDEIFDPFFSSKAFGRGLGLSVALGTVKALGGAIGVETRSDRGASFKVYLPEIEAPVAGSEREARTTSTVAGKTPAKSAKVGERAPIQKEPEERASEATTVLVVEDNAMVRKLAVRILGQMGFQVLEAADGIEALEVFEANQDRIRVVLCDVTMPRLGGWETLTALRRIDPEIPVILTSGYDEATATSESHPEQPDAFVGKPWQLEQLRDVLGEVMGGRDQGHGLIRWE